MIIESILRQNGLPVGSSSSSDERKGARGTAFIWEGKSASAQWMGPNIHDSETQVCLQGSSEPKL